MNTETQQNTESSTLTPISEKQPAQIEFRQVALKVSPAEFSRMIGVSKTSVSNWIKEGRIVIDQAGKIDPKKAVQDVLRTTNPAKLKATFFKNITNDTETLQNEIIRLNKKVGELEKLNNEKSNHAACLVGAFETIILTIKTCVDDSELDYLDSLTDRVAIETELNEIINFNIG